MIGFRLMSERRDFFGRLLAAHFAALSLTCLAKQIVLQNTRKYVRIDIFLSQKLVLERRDL